MGTSQSNVAKTSSESCNMGQKPVGSGFSSKSIRFQGSGRGQSYLFFFLNETCLEKLVYKPIWNGWENTYLHSWGQKLVFSNWDETVSSGSVLLTYRFRL